MFRYLFGVPVSTPKAILRFDLGHLSMKEKVHVKKLNLLHHLKNLPNESLGLEFYQIQVKLNFPGLIKECRYLIKHYELPDIIETNKNYSKECWNKLVKKAVRKKSEKSIKNEFAKSSKLEKLNVSSENLKLHDYVSNMSLRNARTNFRIRSHMIDTKYNKKSYKKNAAEIWRCDDCRSLDSQSHIIWCPAFAPLREGKDLKNDNDLVSYFQEVLKIRSNSC